MTNKEALQAIFDGFEVSDAKLDKAMVDFGLNGSDVYSSSMTKDVDLCAAGLCQSLLTTPPSVSEGGLAIQYDTKALKDLRSQLLSKYGMQTDGPSIDGTALW